MMRCLLALFLLLLTTYLNALYVCAALAVLATPASAEVWRLTIPQSVRVISATGGVYVIEGDGPLPVARPLVPPVVVVPPPVVPPPATPPPRDLTPFVFPTVCRGQGGDTITNRPVYLFTVLRDRPETVFYATLDGENNPSISTHVCAGVIKPGAFVPGSPNRDVSNRQLWVPYFIDGKPIGTTYPDQIRCALATGQACK